MSRPNLHGLLVGVDRYLPPSQRTPDGLPEYPSLQGAGRDARRVATYLRERLEVPPHQLRLLAASRGLELEPPEAEEDRPTYPNLRSELAAICRRVRPGDLALFYFAGHGGQTPSITKGPGLWDECLVPYDITTARGQYLRDVELAAWLADLAAAGAHAVVLLDACHAGSALRREETGFAVRGRGAVRRTAPTPRPGTGSGWLPSGATPQGYTLLAACAAHELAIERPTPDGLVGGVFTHALLAVLDRGADLGKMTWRAVHDRLVPAVQQLAPDQTPQLEGAGDLTVFGRERLPVPRGTVILAVGPEGLRLQAGEVHGLAPGALFSAGVGGRLAEVTALGETESEARWVTADSITRPETGDLPQPGDRAVLLAPAGWARRARVRALGVVPGAAELAQLLTAGPPRAVRWAANDETADFLLRCEDGSEVVVEDATGERLPLPAWHTDPAAAASALDQLARFVRLRDLVPPPGRPEAEAGLALEIAEFPGNGPIEIADGSEFTVELVHRGAAPLYVALLSLGSDWSVQVIWPPGQPWQVLAPGERSGGLRLRARRSWSDRCWLKAVASPEAAAFDWLELPSLSGARFRRAGLAAGAGGWTVRQRCFHFRR